MPEPPLVGRDAELARLRALSADSFGQRRCRAVLLRGEPGIGKSRLLEAAAALAREAGAVVLEAAAYEAESIRPFALFVDALRKLGPNTVTAVFAPGDASSSNRDRLFERLGELIAERAGTQPVVLKFDDLQWATSRAQPRCTTSCARAPIFRVLVLLASRRDELLDNTPVCERCASCARPALSKRSISRRSARTPCARSSARERLEPTPNACARNAAAIRCSRSSLRAPRSPARAANRCAR